MKQLLFILLIGQLYQENFFVTAFCGKLGSFDYACHIDNNFLMVSTFPCQSAGLVQVTVIDKSKPEQLFTKRTYVDLDFRLGSSKKMVSLKIANHTKGPHVGNLHVFVDTYILKNETTRIFDTYFFLEFAAECLKMFTGASHPHLPYCETSRRTGDFSSLCIAKKGVLHPSSFGAAVVGMDPCSHPYSVKTLLFIPNTNQELERTYTANKTDSFIGFNENATNGMKLKINYYDEGLSINVVLKFGSTDHNSVEIINDRFFPDDSLMCPYSHCIPVSPGEQVCHSKLITGHNVVKNLSATISLDPCKTVDVAKISLRLEGYKKVINSTLEVEPIDVKGILSKLQFSEKTVKPKTQGNGFVPEDGGEVSLALMHSFDLKEFFHEELANAVVVIINRHYPIPDYAFPIVRTEFVLDRKECPAHKKRRAEKATVAKVIAGVFVLLVVVVIIVLALLWWRKKKKKGAGGLPYQMEIDTDDPDDFKM